MTELHVAKKLLLEANTRIFDLECHSTEQANKIEDLEDEVNRLKNMPAQGNKQKRKHSTLMDAIVEEYDISDYDELSPEAQPFGRSDEQLDPHPKRVKLSPNTITTLRTQLADTQHQLEHQKGETKAAKRQLHLALTSFPLGEPSTGSATSPASPGHSSFYSASYTLSPERYAPESPTFHYEPRSATTPKPSSPPSPHFHFDGHEVSPLQSSPTYVPLSPGDYVYGIGSFPVYIPSSPAYERLSPVYVPASPEYAMGSTSPTYWPRSPDTHAEVMAVKADVDAHVGSFNPDDL